MRKNNENTNAFLIHICGFAGFLYPLGGIITPLIAWQTLKNRSTFLDEQGKEAVNFNISFSFYKFLLGMLLIPIGLSTFFKNINYNSYFDWSSIEFDLDQSSIFSFLGVGSIVGVLVVIRILLTINAALKAKEGENYKYPFTIKFIK